MLKLDDIKKMAIKYEAGTGIKPNVVMISNLQFIQILMQLHLDPRTYDVKQKPVILGMDICLSDGPLRVGSVIQ